MNKNRTILITSCKGGVGKSTIAANLGFALAKQGQKTLIIDFDLGNRSLDLILGWENHVLYDFCDIALERIGADKAIIPDKRSPNLFFCPAPAQYKGELDEKLVKTAIENIHKAHTFDFILIDTSGGADKSVFLSAPLCQEAIIVTSQQPISIRAAEKSGVILDEYGIGEQYLVINCFGDRPRSANRMSIIEIIDATRTPIIGVVPYEQRLMLRQEQGILAGEVTEKSRATNASAAFNNIAKRLLCERVPLFCGFKRTNRKKLIKY